MGGCIGSTHDGSAPNGESSDGTGAVTIGRNQPLRPERPKWKSDVPLTEGQLRSKRDEFWHTAPAFDGRREIWDALHAAASALETSDHQLAQAIVDGANITLPNGTVMDCYDELGNRYQLPIYVLSAPANLIRDADAAKCLHPADEEEDENEENVEQAPETGPHLVLRLRLSTGTDIKLHARNSDTVLKAKRRLCQQTAKQVAAGDEQGGEEGVDNAGLTAGRQRWYYGGKLLGDRCRLADARIPKGHIVQVIVSEGEDIVSQDS